MTFTMNTKTAPFDNPDVQRALKLAVDRQALVDIILLGYGTVGNDMIGAGLAGYNDEIPQVVRDAATATRLFAAAGVEALTMVVADVAPGIVAAGELFIGQLAEVGVTRSLDQRDPATYYADYAEFLARPLQGLYYVNRPASAFLGNFTGSAAFFNSSGFGDESYDALLAEAQAVTAADDRVRLFEELQQRFHDDGGTLVWGLQEQLDATAPGISGIRVIQSIPLLSGVRRD